MGKKLLINDKDITDFYDDKELDRIESIKLHAYPSKPYPKFDDCFTEKGYCIGNYAIKVFPVFDKFNIQVLHKGYVFTVFSIKEVETEIWKNNIKLPKKVKHSLSYIKRKLDNLKKKEKEKLRLKVFATHKRIQSKLIEINYSYPYDEKRKKRVRKVKKITNYNIVYCVRRSTYLSTSVCKDCKYLVRFTSGNRPLCRIF